MSPLLDEVRPLEHSIIYKCLSCPPISSQASPSVPALRSGGQSHFAPYPWMYPHHQKLRIPRSSLILRTNPQIALYCHQLFCLHPLNPSTSWNTFTPGSSELVTNRQQNLPHPPTLLKFSFHFLFNQNQFKPIILTRRENLPSPFPSPVFEVEWILPHCHFQSILPQLYTILALTLLAELSWHFLSLLDNLSPLYIAVTLSNNTPVPFLVISMFMHVVI